ncbi:MAG: BatA domain-containing protein [Vicinamibacterales bacterium]
MKLILLSPAGLVALVALVAPILVHLLLRRRARRMLFPSLRFIQPSNAVAVRLRAITDWPLLVVRCGIVAVAALALARPLLVTPARREGWNARTARAVVVDVTPSAGHAAAAAQEERRTAFRSTVIETSAIGAGIVEAVRWLEATPPARRELIVISDFQRGTIDRMTLDRAPASVGVRLRQVMPSGASAVAVPDVRVDVHAPERDRVMAEAALRAAGQDSGGSGGRAGLTSRRIAIYTRGTQPPHAVGPLRAPWMATAANAVTAARTGATNQQSMVVILDAPASSFELPRAIRAVRRALLAPAAWHELEPDHLPAATLAAWSRPAPPIAVPDVAHAEDDDGRWLWLATLALIGLETGLRRRLDAGVAGPASAETARAA